MPLCKCGCGQETNCSSEYSFGHWNRTNEVRQKLSRERMGAKNPFYGKHHSEEHKQKVSKKQKGKIVSKETRKKQSDARKTRVVLEETRKKTSKASKKMWQDKEYREKQIKRMMGSNNPMYGKRGKLCPSFGKPLGRRYKRIYHQSPLQGTVCFRSSWEYEYAKYLDSIHELWYYEIETFELLGGMTYTPDFYLPRLDKFIEIKGRCWNKESKKYQKFQEEYPFNLEVFFSKDLKEMGLEI